MMQLNFLKTCALCFLLIILVQQTTCYSHRAQTKLLELNAKLQEKIAATSIPPIHSPSPTFQPSVPKKEGRVLYPIGYGADPTGEEESSEAMLNALNDAFEMQNRNAELLPGVKDLGGVIVDLQGGNYKINKPLTFPPSGGGNILVKEGTLRASDTFPEDRHLIELFSPNSHAINKLDHHHSLHSQSYFSDEKSNSNDIYYEDITFQDILFDSNYKGGGIFIIDSARIHITDCFFLHFTTQGILVEKGHETFISGCFMGQHSTVGGDPGEKQFSGTAIDLASNDNAITDVVIFSAAIGVSLRGQANIVTGVHCYNKATYWGGIGILVKLYASLTRIDNCYLDYNAIVMEDPVQVHVTNGLFLGEGNIVMKSINGKISGVNILNNMFNGSPRNMVPIVALDGTFSSIDQVVIDHNNVNGMSLKSTTGKLTVAGNGTKWIVDFLPVLLFPNRISHFGYSFYMKEGTTGLPISHSVTNVSNNVVSVESDKMVSGVVSVIVDQYNMPGENNVL